MKHFIIIGFLLLTQHVYSQNDITRLGKTILAADSAIIFTSLKNSSLDLADSTCCDSIIYLDLFKIKVRLTNKTKTGLANLLIKPSNFSGRFVSQSGFLPTEIVVLWTDRKVSYIKVSRRTHDLMYSEPSNNFFFIDPVIVDRLTQFYKKIKLNRK